MATQIRRHSSALSCEFTADVPAILRRVYAARGLRSDADLDLSLERLLPVGSLEGVGAAAQLLMAHRSAGRVLVIGDFDADGATSTAYWWCALCAPCTSRTSISWCPIAFVSATG